MLLAESAILVHFQSVGGIFAVFIGIVVTLFAFRASQHYLYSVTFFRCHKIFLPSGAHPPDAEICTQKITPLTEVLSYDTTVYPACQRICKLCRNYFALATLFFEIGIDNGGQKAYNMFPNLKRRGVCLK